MENYVINLLNSMTAANSSAVYCILFISAVIENLFPPIPGDTITAFGAFLVGSGRLTYFGVYASTTLGSVTGFYILFLLGKFFGREFFLQRDYTHFSAEKIKSAERWFSRYGYAIVLANRFMPGIRSAISIVAGISMLSNVRVLAYSLASAAVWNLIWIQTGFMLGNNWDIVKHKMQMILRNYTIAVTAVVVLAALTAMAIHLYKKMRTRRGAQQKPD